MPTPTPDIRVRGTVLHADGTPAVGVTVHVFSVAVNQGNRVTTDHAGAFAAQNTFLGQVKVSLDVPAGYQAVPVQTIVVVANQTPSPIPFILTPTLAPGQTGPSTPVQVPTAIAPGATPTATPTVQPVVTAAVSTGLLCGAGKPATTPTYTTGMTGIAWLSSSAVATTRAVRRLWHTHAGYAAWPNPFHRADPVAYPAPTVDPDNCLSVETVAVIYDAPGTYSVTVDATPWDEQTNAATGPAVTYGQTVVRPVDTRPTYYFAVGGNDANAGTAAAPLLSAAKLAAVVKPGNVRVVIVAPLVMDWPAGVSPGDGTTLEGVPTADGTLPVVHLTGPTCAIGIDSAVSDVLIRNIRFTATGVPAASIVRNADGTLSAVGTGPLSLAPTAIHGGRAQAGNSWGNGVLFDGCEFDCLIQFVQQWAGDGFGVTRSVQIDPLAMTGEVMSSWGGTRPLFAFNVLLGITVDSLLRVDGAGHGQGLGVEWNYVIESNPTSTGGSDKPAPDIRAADRFVIAHNAMVNLQLGLSDSHGLAGCTDGLVADNVFRSADGVHPGSLSIEGKVGSVAVAGNDFGACAGAKWAAVSASRSPEGNLPSALTIGTNTYAPGVTPLSAASVPASVLTVK